MSKLSLFAVSLSAATLALTDGITPAFADMTKENKIICTPERFASCKKDGACQWKPASARDRATKLMIDFAAGKAFLLREGREPRAFGNLYTVAMKDGRRTFVVARKPDARASRRNRISVGADGSFRSARGDINKRRGEFRGQGTCVKG